MHSNTEARAEDRHHHRQWSGEDAAQERGHDLRGGGCPRIREPAHRRRHPVHRPVHARPRPQAGGHPGRRSVGQGEGRDGVRCHVDQSLLAPIFSGCRTKATTSTYGEAACWWTFRMSIRHGVVRRGVLISKLELPGDDTNKPTDHVPTGPANIPATATERRSPPFSTAPNRRVRRRRRRGPHASPPRPTIATTTTR